MDRQQAIKIAAKMRAMGHSYQQIAEVLGRKHETVRRWLNPDIEEVNRQANARRAAARRRERLGSDPEYRERVAERERMKNPEYRAEKMILWRQRAKDRYEQNVEKILADRKIGMGKVLRALQKSNETAKLRGYMPCTASPEEVFAALTGVCYVPNCGREPKVLQLEHCHKTGEFRGWACNRCNAALGRLGDDMDALQEYLKTAPPVSDYRGIGWRPVERKWEAKIEVNRERWRVGQYHSEFDAARAYDIVASAEGRPINFPDFYGEQQ